MNYGPAEMMVVALAREIGVGEVVFHGLASPVPMTAMKLAKALGKEFTYLNITGGVDPDWTQPARGGSTLSAHLYTGAVSTYGLDEIFDLACSGRVDISFLSLVQISQRGEINMSYIGGDYDRPKVRLPGGAGSATLMPVTRRTTIWKTGHDKNSFVSEVNYCTAKAQPSRPIRVVTNFCVMAMVEGLLQVESIHPYSSWEEVQENTGWEINRTGIATTSPPTAEELAALERVDPQRIRYAEFK